MDHVCNNRETEFTAPMDCAKGQSGSGAGETGDLTPPSVPGSLSSTSEMRALHLTWIPSTDSGGSGLDRYFMDVSTNSLFNPYLPGWAQHDLGAALSTSLTGLSLNTTYFIRMRAKDVAGNLSTFASLTTNTLADQDPPTVFLISPIADTLYRSALTVSVVANALDNEDVTKVCFIRNGVTVATDTVAPYQFLWPITAADNGIHSWTATAFDAMGNRSTTAGLPVTVNIDVLSPSTPVLITLTEIASTTVR